MHNDLIIGQVINIRTNSYDKRIGTLRPLFAADSNNQWHRVDQPKEMFPNRGLIFWQLPEEHIALQSLWRVRLEESFTYEATNPERDQYSVLARPSPEPVPEIINLESVPNLEWARILVEKGLHLSFEPSSRVYIQVANQLVGPVRLVKIAEQSWGLDEATRRKELPVVDMFHLSELIKLNEAGDNRTFVITSRKPSPVAAVDWATDEQTLKRVLDLARTNDCAYMETVRLTKDVIRQVMARVFSADQHDNVTIQQQRVRRANAFITTVILHKSAQSQGSAS